MATKIRPIADRVVVKRLENESKSAGGIVIPDNAQEKPITGKVIAVGTGKISNKGEPLKPEVSTGDKIVFGKYSGTEINLDGEEYLILKEDEIMAILD